MINLECQKKNVISPSWNLNGEYMNDGWNEIFIKHTTT
jgi:hypothetical protein